MGDVLVVVEEGRIVLDVMRHVGISRERLFSVLRVADLEHLGQAQRVYAEPTGEFSILREQNQKAGLSVLPTFDDKIRNKDRQSKNQWACFSCGSVKEASAKPAERCRYCDSSDWTEAVETLCAGANN